MATKAAAKTKAPLNKSDIAQKAERWARLQADIKKLVQAKDQDQELNEAIQRVEELGARHDAEIEKLEERADGIRTEVIGWLLKQKKAITVEAKHAIAKLLKGSKPGSRQVNPEKFIARCTELGKDPWPAVNVVIKTGEPILGKNDFDAICTKEQVEFADASLELK